MLRSTIASMKELLEMKMIDSIKWVPTHKQLADCLTKKGRKADWLMKIIESNTLFGSENCSLPIFHSK